MKATGIVRRIDELGRIVIPKEIRRTQRIRQGDSLEIFTAADGEVVFKKYSPLSGLGSLSKVYAEVLAKSLGRPVVVCDTHQIVAAAGESCWAAPSRRSWNNCWRRAASTQPPPTAPAACRCWNAASGRFYAPHRS